MTIGCIIGGNGAWRTRMRTMNLKSNRTCLYRRSDRGLVLAKFVAHNLSIFMSIIIIIILYVSSYHFSYLSSSYSNNMCYIIFMTYLLLYFLFI